VGVGLIDMASLFAAFVYVLVALAIVTLFRILFSTAGQTRNVSTVEYVD